MSASAPRIQPVGVFECKISNRRPTKPYTAFSFGELFSTYAMPDIDRLKRLGDIGVVCGSISTPLIEGLTVKETVRENLKRFNQAIRYTQCHVEGIDLCNIWDQMPYELAIERLAHRAIEEGSYDNGILEKFYKPVFEYAIPKLTYAFFIPGWEQSIGASWERRTLTAQEVKCVDLPGDWQVRALALGIQPTSPY